METLLYKICQNICNDIAVNANFKLSTYRSMAIVSCYNNINSHCLSMLYTKFGINGPCSFREVVV